VSTPERPAGDPAGPPAEPATSSGRPAQVSRLLFRFGLGLAALEGAALVAVWLTEPGLFARIVAVAGAAFVGGRMPGILTGLELGLGGMGTSAVNILLNTCWLLVALPVFQHATRTAGRSKLVQRYLSGTERRAREQTGRVSRFGLLGLALFVWLPFPATGAFVGAIIGMVMGIPTGRLVAILLGSMWIGVITWTYGIELVFVLTGTTGRIVAWVATAGFLASAAAGRWRRPAAGGDP
jgi:uncharacterized membrane protein